MMQVTLPYSCLPPQLTLVAALRMDRVNLDHALVALATLARSASFLALNSKA